MSKPKIKLLAVSNVYSRMMFFEKSGDVEEGHKHTHDHGTLVSSGRVKVDILDDDKETILHSKEYVSPTFIYIKKDNYHRLTALEDNTVCTCIHALRTVDEDIIDPDFLIDNQVITPENSKHILVDMINEKYNKPHLAPAIISKKENTIK